MSLFLLNKKRIPRYHLTQFDARKYCSSLKVEILPFDIDVLNNVAEPGAKQPKLLNLIQSLLGKTGNDNIEINMVLTKVDNETAQMEAFVCGLILGQVERGFKNASLGMKLVIGIYDKGVQIHNFDYGAEQISAGGYWKFDQRLEATIARKLEECSYYEASVTLQLVPVTTNLSPEFANNKQMLENKFSCDTGITCQNGVIAPCHKYILATNSRFFRQLFHSNQRAGTVDDLNLRAECVDAMLKFLYYRDVDDFEENPNLAMELLTVANEKRFLTLKDYLTKFLMEQSSQRFNVEQGVQLFTETQGWVVTKVFRKRQWKNLEELKNSREFKTLLENNYEMGMQLVMCMATQRSVG
ncbi:Kelch-like protein 40 [Orchesella cincta]|uniref:Kelch-like protein 40 n=1 Tax=Orchesella cincta TaxID=48709 RepID=A0A1D2NCX6_ORCCI|nr:Kelch-like protein 40 [Orchesella cincta]